MSSQRENPVLRLPPFHAVLGNKEPKGPFIRHHDIKRIFLLYLGSRDVISWCVKLMKLYESSARALGAPPQAAVERNCLELLKHNCDAAFVG